MNGLLIRECIKAAVNEWDNAGGMFSNESLNRFIEKHEGTMVTFGMFVRGLRVKPQTTEYHEKLDGVLGIVSMNMYILRAKIPPENTNQ